MIQLAFFGNNSQTSIVLLFHCRAEKIIPTTLTATKAVAGWGWLERIDVKDNNEGIIFWSSPPEPRRQ
jgi:hypothetical protein